MQMSQYPITLEDVRQFTQEMESGNIAKLVEETFDENIEWEPAPPYAQDLEKPSLTGASRVQIAREARAPLIARFVDPEIKFETVDICIQPPELNDPSERHLTKAVVQMKGSAVLKKSGKNWTNYSAHVLYYDNATKKVVKARVYQDTAAINRALEE